jgi:hypothetical protein
LRKLTDPFVERVASAAVDDMQARYEFGVALAALRDATHASWFEQVARMLDVDSSALRRIARTTEVIAPEEFAWLSQLRTRGGKALAWSQVELLARQHDRRRRRQLALAIAREDLSVRALAKRVVQTPAAAAL